MPAFDRDSSPNAEAAGSVSRPLVLVNPRSFRMSLRGRLPRIAELARSRRAHLLELSDPCDIRLAIEEKLKQGCRLLIIIGGDGTVQAAVTALANLPDHDPGLRILVLGGGRTNYTARDIGTHDRLLSTLETALDKPDQLIETERQTLLVDHPEFDQPLHGFFIAGALVDFIIRDCHNYRSRGQGVLRRGHLSTAWRVLQLVALAALGRGGFQAAELSICSTELGQLRGPVRLLLLTSLHHRDEWVDPYADRGKGNVRLSAVTSNAHHFWRRLPRLIMGRYHRDMLPAAGYLSGMSQEIKILGLAGISLDGQELDLNPQLPLSIRSGPSFHFLHP